MSCGLFNLPIASDRGGLFGLAVPELTRGAGGELNE
jgi:hypothetical protein